MSCTFLNELIDRVIDSIIHCCMFCNASRGDYTPYLKKIPISNRHINFVYNIIELISETLHSSSNFSKEYFRPYYVLYIVTQFY